jgi:hypothetical protein
MKDAGTPIACPILTRIFRLVLVHNNTQLLHTWRISIKKYYHNKTETLQQLPGAQSFYMRSVHFGIPSSYLSSCTFPKYPHFSTAVLQFPYLDSYFQFATCLTKLFIQSVSTEPNYRVEINPLTPNDLYKSRTTPLTSKHSILYIYSTNIGTEYFKHALYSPFFLFKMQFVS